MVTTMDVPRRHQSDAQDHARPDSVCGRELIGLSRQELADQLAEMGEKPFRAKQLWHWLYYRGATDFAVMDNLAKPLRQRLAERFTIGRPHVVTQQTSCDQTRKWLFQLADGNQVETVFIPEEDRGAVCLSTQVGCTLTCRFCRTGTQRLVRNLTSAEIVGQFLAARDAYGEWPTPVDGQQRLLSNVVVMGMGEPLFNYQATAQALKILMDPEGVALSRRRITLSTAGVVPMMRQCGEELGVNLAVSLHAATDRLRDQLMPINRKYPLAQLMAACRDYPGAHNARRITFEYVMLKGINDSPADARALVRLVAGIPCKFNLIPFNPWRQDAPPGQRQNADAPQGSAPGEVPHKEAPSPTPDLAMLDCSSAAAMRRFSEILNDNNLSAPIRVSRGQDISAACGQLKSESRRLSYRERGDRVSPSE